MTFRSRRQLLPTALLCRPYWCAEQMGMLFSGAKAPKRAAEAWASREEQAGWLCSELLDVCLPPAPEAPLATLQAGRCSIDFDRLEYRLRQRWAIESRWTRVYWPSRAFARRFGSWSGTDSLSCPHKIGHDLLCTWVWLRYLAISETVATECWISEWQWMQQARRGESIPDAVIMLPDEVVLVEVCGNYSAKLLRRRWERISRQMPQRFENWTWELW